MNCHKCGTILPNDAVFCPKCGAKLQHDDSNSVALLNRISRKNIVIVLVCFVIIVIVTKALLFQIEEPENQETNNTNEIMSSSTNISVTTDQILIRGIPVADIIGMSAEEVIEIFGEPEIYSEYSTIEYGSSYSERICFNLTDSNTVSDFVANAEYYSYNEQSLSQNFDTIVSILGESYENRGGGRYSFPVAWQHNGCDVVFEFPIIETDEWILDIYVFPAKSAEYTQNDTIISIDRDPNLIGRWRSYDGGLLEFDADGNITNCDFKCWSIGDASPDNVTWRTENGRVYCSAYFYMEYKYELIPPTEENNYEILKMHGSEFKRVEGTVGDGLVGKWNNTFFGSSLSRQFNADQSGMLNGKYNLIYWYTYQSENNDDLLCYGIEDPTFFDYKINGDILTIFLSDTSQVYTKVGD